MESHEILKFIRLVVSETDRSAFFFLQYKNPDNKEMDIDIIKKDRGRIPLIVFELKAAKKSVSNVQVARAISQIYIHSKTYKSSEYVIAFAPRATFNKKEVGVGLWKGASLNVLSKHELMSVINKISKTKKEVYEIDDYHLFSDMLDKLSIEFDELTNAELGSDDYKEENINMIMSEFSLKKDEAKYIHLELKDYFSDNKQGLTKGMVDELIVNKEYLLSNKDIKEISSNLSIEWSEVMNIYKNLLASAPISNDEMKKYNEYVFNGSEQGISKQEKKILDEIKRRMKW